MPYSLTFEATGINADLALIHDNESFHVQWKAVNAGPDDTAAFIDRLVITKLPAGCPGEDSPDTPYPVVYDSTTDGQPADFAEPVITAGQTGPLMTPLVGPSSASSYRLTVTLDDGGPNPFTQASCVDVLESSSS